MTSTHGLYWRSTLRVDYLSLANFRNYRCLDLRLPPYVTVIQGQNAQGKTNLLEAIHVLSTTRSHRTASDRDLVHHLALEETPSFGRLCAEVHRDRGDVTIEIVLRLETMALPGDRGGVAMLPSGVPVRKRIRVNHVARRAADCVGQLNVVMFSAEDIDLITGSPVLCRRYLDLVNSQTDSRYLRCLQRYHKVLSQRNHLLKLLQERQAKPDQLEFWDGELVDSGSYIVMERHRLVARLDELARGIHEELSSGSERLQLAYVPNAGGRGTAGEVDAAFRRALRQSRAKEISQGVTLVGPHRDNLLFQINGADTSRYGSRGQQQTAALSLKLAEAKYMHAQVGDLPVLLLDDVFSELDRSRRQHLLESIVPFQQVLITAVDLDSFEPSFLAQASRLRVSEGNVEPA